MATLVRDSNDSLLKQIGFVTPNGDDVPGVVRLDSINGRVDTYLRYATLLRDLELRSHGHDFIYESPGVDPSLGFPCGYFASFDDEPPYGYVAALRTQLWNHGQLPTLWIVTPQTVRIYDAFARPTENDETNPLAHVLGQLTAIKGFLDELEGFHREHLDSGSFWNSGPGTKVASEQRVDRALLRDLHETRGLLCKYGLTESEAHSLLGRAVFVKYLEDREILRWDQLDAVGNISSFRELLGNAARTREFFSQLEDKINGDMFPQSYSELPNVNMQHLDIVRCFLSGDRMEGYPEHQAGMWPYSFKTIPVEFISSIYEMFAHSTAPEDAEAHSVHYTRRGLVGLVLSLSMANLPETARVLDPACGSGVFLVEAFRRLVWTKEARLGGPLSREEIRAILRGQIFGIDVDRDAVFLASFSLNLALMELDPDLPSIDGFKLPGLLNTETEDASPNLYVQDFLNVEHNFNRAGPFLERGFDLVVSNPPWTAWTESTAPQDPEVNGEGIRWGLEYMLAHGIPDRKPDQAFMTRARDFTQETSRIAMVVGTRFLRQSSAKGKRWRDQFFGNNTIHSILDLSDLVSENILFGRSSSTRLPASVVIFSPKEPSKDTSFEYLAPKRYSGIRRREQILLTSADTQTIRQSVVVEPGFQWTAAFRGSPRDLQLLHKLGALHTLDQVLNRAEIEKGTDRGRGISFGNAGQRDAGDFKGLPFLPGQQEKQRYSISVASLEPFQRTTIASRSSNLILRLPALVLARRLVDRLPTVALVEPTADLDRLVIQDTYNGISFGHTNEWLARRLNALLNSEFALYVAFMVGLELGIGRRVIEQNDWYRMPMPRDIFDRGSSSWHSILEWEAILRSKAINGDDISHEQSNLNELIYEVYELSEQEKVLIKDTVQYTINPHIDKSERESAASSNLAVQQLESYASQVANQLNGILRYAGQFLSAVVCVLPDNSPLAACRFVLTYREEEVAIQKIQYPDLTDLLSAMSDDLSRQVADNLFLHRDLRVYDSEGFWIFKPAERRLWSEASALNDADAVFLEHLRSSSLS